MAKDPVFVSAGRLGAHVVHSRHDGREITAAARAKADQRFLDQARAEAAERGEKVRDAELERRAAHLRAAFYARMQLKSVQDRQRRNKKTAGGTAGGQEVRADAAAQT